MSTIDIAAHADQVMALSEPQKKKYSQLVTKTGTHEYALGVLKAEKASKYSWIGVKNEKSKKLSNTTTKQIRTRKNSTTGVKLAGASRQKRRK